MKNIFTWIGVALVVVSTIIGQFTGVEVATWVKLAGYSAGLASCIVGIFKSTEKKDWKLYVSVIGICVGTMLCVFAGLIESQITAIITGVAGLVVLIISVLPVLFTKKKTEA